MRAVVVRTRRLEQIEQVLGVAQIGEIGPATTRMSSALISVRLVHPTHWCGTSSTMQGTVARNESMMESKASVEKS